MSVRAWLLRNVRDWDSPLGTMAVRVAGLGVNFGVLAFIAKLAGQESLGLVIALNSAAFVGGAVLSYGVPTFLLKTMTGYFLAEQPGLAAAEYRRGLTVVIKASAMGIGVAAVFAACQSAGMLPVLGSLGAVEILAAGVCSVSLAVQFVGLSAVRALKQPAMSGAFQFFTQPLLLLCATMAGLGLWGDLSARTTVAVVCTGIVGNAILVLAYARKRLQEACPAELVPLPKSELRSLWLLSMLSNASANAPLILAAALFTPAGVALLGVPFRICNLPMTLIVALGTYYAPLLRESFIQNNAPRQAKELRESQLIGGVLVLPVLLGAGLLPAPILGLFGLHDAMAESLFLLFAVSQLLIASCGVSEQYLAMVGKARVANVYTLAGLLGMVVAGPVLFSRYGALGLGSAWAFFAVARQLGLLVQSRRMIAGKESFT